MKKQASYRRPEAIGSYGDLVDKLQEYVEGTADELTPFMSAKLYTKLYGRCDRANRPRANWLGEDARAHSQSSRGSIEAGKRAKT